mmetsp:Transcript_18115/g.38254  ORF Transcript_18115/g.38254 Transcript_18115/m.38254 type:complete len:229 (-) Transcript_18115:108-794(-)
MSRFVCVAVLAMLATAQAFSGGSLHSMRLRNSAVNQRQCSLNSIKMSDNEESKSTPLDRRAVLTGLFGLLVTGPLAFPGDAEAARSGGRISSGGIKASRSVRVAPRSAPAPAPAPAASPSVTVIQSPPTTIIQTVPSYGYGGFGGGYSYAPSYGLSTGAWLGLTALELAEAVAREQRRAAFLNQQLETQRQLGKDQAEIEALQRQIKEQNDKLNAMQTTLSQKAVEAK